MTGPAGATDDWATVNLIASDDPSAPTPATGGNWYYWWFDAGAGPVSFAVAVTDDNDPGFPVGSVTIEAWTGPDADNLSGVLPDVDPEGNGFVSGPPDNPPVFTTTATEGQRYIVGVTIDVGWATLVFTATGAPLAGGGGGGGGGGGTGEPFVFGTTVRVAPPVLPAVKAANPTTLIEGVAVPDQALRLKAPSVAPAIVDVPASNQLVVPQVGPEGPNGPEGPAGPSGPIGPVGDLDESIPDLSLIFENGLV